MNQNTKSKPDDPFTNDDWGPSEGPSSDLSTEMPEPNIDPDRSTPFLKPVNLRERVGYLELVRVSGATKYSDITLHVKVGSIAYRLGLRTFDPSYEALKKKFGKNPADWHGQLRYKIMPHNGNSNGFVAVRPA